MGDALVQGTISRLGFLEDGVYNREPDCFDGLRDLIRFLHNDDRNFIVRRTCASHNVIKHDLVPIMKADDSNEELFDASLRLVVNLSQPTTMVMASQRHDEDNDNKIKIYCELESGLLRSLSAFADAKFYEVLATKLKSFFDLKVDERAEKKKILIERIIVLLRYILAIGYDTAKYAQVEEVNCRVQENVIRTFLQSDIPNIIFDVICTNREREFSLHFLSIFALVVKPFNGTKVAAVGEEAEKDIQEKEKEERRLRITSSLGHLTLKNPPSRGGRSFLGGMYEVKGMNAINKNNAFIVNKPVLSDKNLLTSMSTRKTAARIPKNRAIADFTENSLGTGSNTSSETLLALKQFTSKFIDACYNRLMKQSKDQAFLSNLSLTHKYSEIHFFVVVEYIMEFARTASIPVKQILQTFSKEFFHDVLSRISTYFELIKTDKDNAKTYTLKAQHAISAYKQMILFLNYLDNDATEDTREYYHTICHYIFELQEYREMGYTFLTAVSPGSCSRKLLEDLVITNHFYLHIMEREVKRGELRKVTEKRKARKKRKKAEKKDGEGGEDIDMTDIPLEQVQAIAFTKKYDDTELNEIWESIADDFAGVINTQDSFEHVSLFDIHIPAEENDLQGFIFLKIQHALREKRLKDAYNLYRSARTRWSDGTFGSEDMSSEEEFNELQTIFNAPLDEFVEKYKKVIDDLYVSPKNGEEKENEEEKEVEFNELSEDEQHHIMEDVQFNMDEYIGNYCHPDIISWYTFLLKNYGQNSLELNKAILKLFHRIAFDLNAPSRLYNATFFRILQRLHSEMGGLSKPQQKAHVHFEFYRFGHHLLTKFFEHYNERGTILVNEVILPKNSKECYEIEHGYGTHKGARGNIKKDILWPKELEEEVKSLHKEYTNFDDKPEGLDVVDFIKANLSRERERRQILKKIKQLYL